MLGQPRKLGVGPGASENLGVARGNHAPAFALERMGDDSRAATSIARANDRVHKIHQLVRESYSDLLAHPIMVANW